ncbi:hypothetical protein DPX39_110069500 [Trypanosoma brucei equiperdum]|uniref:Tectonic-1-3 N-terminal domain-containing protein n=1 Tax=Trypanosoma brucei equiperdum TaxID=630700 RepID=A0A3L6KUI6_9TRYP|nr:hypothetical protein DPX39_110069500 [Trypanosoma brucei equiperdum]
MIRVYVAAVSTILCAVAERPVTYPIQWDDVPLKQPPARVLSSPYLGRCACDDTWGSCDPNCCCDDDCSASERNKFHFCLREGWTNHTLERCQQSFTPTKTTVGERGYINKSIIGHRALCIIKSNNVGDMSPFFTLPEKVSNPFGAHRHNRLGSSNPKSYEVNGIVNAFKKTESSDSVHGLRNAGFLSIPSSSWDGYCVPNSKQIRFMKPIDSTTCIYSGERICAHFPTTSFADLLLGSEGNTNPRGLIPIILQVIDDVTGEILADIGPESSFPRELNSAVKNGICERAVVRAQHSILYSSEGAHLFIVNATSRLYTRHLNTNAIVSLLFQMEFFKAGTRPPLNYFSGNIGYLCGSRIRAGALVEEGGKVGIAERVSGFSVPGTGASCFNRRYRKVGFLHSVIGGGCTVQMSERELRDICRQNGTGKLLRSILGIDTLTLRDFDDTNPIDHIAKTADAHTNDTSSWLPLRGLDFDDIAPEPYDLIERRCRNVYVGLNYSFVISQVGAVGNPQDVIVGAFVDPIIGSWMIRNVTDFTINATSTQRFRFSVSFTRLDRLTNPIVGRKVVSPSIFPRLDDSVFHPFK